MNRTRGMLHHENIERTYYSPLGLHNGRLIFLDRNACYFGLKKKLIIFSILFFLNKVKSLFYLFV